MEKQIDATRFDSVQPNRADGKTAHEPDPGSVLNLTQALVSEWEQIPAAGSTCGGKTYTRRTEADTLTPVVVVMFVVHILLAVCSCSDHGSLDKNWAAKSCSLSFQLVLRRFD